MRAVVGLVLAMLMAMASSVSAQLSVVIPLEGRLSPPPGVGAGGATTFELRLYDSVAAITAIHQESQVVSFDPSGRFSTMLGETQPLPLASMRRPLFLGVREPGKEEMSPRLSLSPAAFSLFAHAAESMDTDSFMWLPADGTSRENGEALRALLAARGSGTQEEYRVLWLGPGTFDLGSDPLDLPGFWILRGSGSRHTRITCTGQESERGTVNVTGTGASNDTVYLRDLEVENTGGASHAVGVVLSTSSRYVVLVDSRVHVVDGAVSTRGVFAEDLSSFGSPQGGRVIRTSLEVSSSSGVVVGVDAYQNRCIVVEGSMRVVASGSAAAFGVRTQETRSYNSVLLRVNLAVSGSGSGAVTGVSITNGGVNFSGKLDVSGSTNVRGIVARSTTPTMFQVRVADAQIEVRGSSDVMGLDLDMVELILEDSEIHAEDATTAGVAIRMDRSIGTLKRGILRAQTATLVTLGTDPAPNSAYAIQAISTQFLGGPITGTLPVGCLYAVDENGASPGLSGCP